MNRNTSASSNTSASIQIFPRYQISRSWYLDSIYRNIYKKYKNISTPTQKGCRRLRRWQPFWVSHQVVHFLFYWHLAPYCFIGTWPLLFYCHLVRHSFIYAWPLFFIGTWPPTFFVHYFFQLPCTHAHAYKYEGSRCGNTRSTCRDHIRLMAIMKQHPLRDIQEINV